MSKKFLPEIITKEIDSFEGEFKATQEELVKLLVSDFEYKEVEDDPDLYVKESFSYKLHVVWNSGGYFVVEYIGPDDNALEVAKARWSLDRAKAWNELRKRMH